MTGVANKDSMNKISGDLLKHTRQGMVAQLQELNAALWLRMRAHGRFR